MAYDSNALEIIENYGDYEYWHTHFMCKLDFALERLGCERVPEAWSYQSINCDNTKIAKKSVPLFKEKYLEEHPYCEKVKDELTKYV